MILKVSIMSKSQRPRSIDEADYGSSAQGDMSSTGNTPLFRTVQLRQIPFLPVPDAASICTAGSQSRVGSKRIKNINLLPLDSSSAPRFGSPVAAAVTYTSNALATVFDPLKLPNSRRDEISQIIFNKSMEEMKVRIRLMHACKYIFSTDT